MWQPYRLIDPENPNQFLGDMFEFFLDQGVKQSEGQYFTPMPICRFLIQSLPLESLVAESPSQPRAIDYACGAGHFLNELALQLKPIIENHLANTDLEPHEIEQRLAVQRSEIYGIEKEYRLSKISKVSAFMYQQPEIKLAYADALVRDVVGYPEIKNGSFDILVANPPYSVKGFLETLPDEERARFRLTETINDAASANSIETFFIERAAQLLAPGGVAAIILPVSIISNGGATYTRAREILLQSFDVVAITEFGSGTFGKTPSTTLTLFLRRKASQPTSADHFKDRIDEWFKGVNASKSKAKAYQDEHLVEAYACHCEIDPEEYMTLFEGDPSEALFAHATFAAYAADFDKLATTKVLKNQRKFKNLTSLEQERDLRRRLVAHICSIERDKLLYFLLAHSQGTPVLILKSPTITKELKEFLGYSWDGSKESPGIKLVTDSDGNHLTPLYDPGNHRNPGKISHAIACNFQGKLDCVPDALAGHLSLHSLEDLLDFSRNSFEKQISLTPRKKINIRSKWPLKPIRELAEFSGDRISASALTESTYVGVDNLLQNFAGRVNSSFTPEEGKVTGFQKGDILMSNIRPYLKKIWFATHSGGASNDVLVLRLVSEEISSLYLFCFLTQQPFIDFVMAGAKGVKMPRGDKNYILSFQVPLPSPEIQRRIITECGAIDKNVETALNHIANARAAIKESVLDFSSKAHPTEKIDVLMQPISGARTKIPQEAIRSDGKIPVITQEGGVLVSGYCDDTEMITDIPLVVFGDHTCVFKYIDFDFVRGADGTQLIKFDPAALDSKFAHAVLSHSEITNAGKYERHFKYVKEMRIPIPPPAEQKKLVAKIEKQEAIITEAEAVITSASAQKAAILKMHLE